MALHGVKHPIEINDPTLGRVFVGGWNVGTLSKLADTIPSDLPADDFVRRVLQLAGRSVSGDAPINSESYNKGAPIEQEKLSELSAVSLDDLARQYFEASPRAFSRLDGSDDPALKPGERESERLQRLMQASLDDFRKTIRRATEALSQPFDKFKSLVSSDLFKAGAETSRLIKELKSTIDPFSSSETVRRLKELREAMDPASSLGFKSPIDGLTKAKVRDILGDPSLFKNGGELGQDEILRQIGPAAERIRLPAIPPNPIHKTNDLLRETGGRINRMVEISERQAQLIQSLAETANLAMAEAAASSNQARESARLAKHGVYVAVIAIVISAFISIAGIVFDRFDSADSDRATANLTSAVEHLARTQGDTAERLAADRAQSTAIMKSVTETLFSLSTQLNEMRRQSTEQHSEQHVEATEKTPPTPAILPADGNGQ